MNEESGGAAVVEEGGLRREGWVPDHHSCRYLWPEAHKNPRVLQKQAKRVV